MKKTLLFVAALTASLCSNAQDLVVFNTDNSYLSDIESKYTEHTDSKGKTYSAADFTEETTIGDCDAFTVLASPSAWSLKSNNAFVINGSMDVAKGGIQGDTNPNVSMTPGEGQEFVEPTTGSYLIVKAKKDGYVYVFHKASSNKNYGVFEEGVAIPYNFIALSNKETLKSPYYFEVAAKQVTADGDTYYVVDRDNATYAKGIDWPENICTSFRSDAQNADGTWNKIGAGGSGVISFPVATGLTYKITAQGSKITASAVCFNATNDLAIAEKDGDGVVTNLTDKDRTDGKPSVWPEAGTSGIKAVVSADGSVELDAKAPVYNLAGQHVSNAYKGVVLQNGHKFINK